MGHFILPLPPDQLRLIHQEHDHQQRPHHDAAHNGKQREIGTIHIALCLVQEGGNEQIDNAAQSAHQVDHGVGLGPQGLGGHIGHQGHRRGPVGAHGNEQQAQHADEGCQLSGSGDGVVAVRDQGQGQHQRHRRDGSAQDKGTASSQRAFAPVGNTAEQRKQHQSQHIVRRHNGAGDGLI